MNIMTNIVILQQIRQDYYYKLGDNEQKNQNVSIAKIKRLHDNGIVFKCHEEGIFNE